MYKIFFIIAFASTLLMGSIKMQQHINAIKQPIAEPTASIGLASFLQLINNGNVLIIDMRQAREFGHSHIQEAFSIHDNEALATKEQLEDKLIRSHNIILYSNGGVNNQMKQYAEGLAKRGKHSVFFYSGGLLEWQAAGLPLEKRGLEP